MNNIQRMDKKSIIKILLTGRLTKSQRKDIADLDFVNTEIKKQWDESGNRMVDMAIKEQIWKKVKAKSIHKKQNKNFVEQKWYFIAASVTLLLAVGGLWLSSQGDKPRKEFIEITAQESQVHVLPDSTKVWMESGSSIRYAKVFNQNRKVWLKGNSLFEVYKHEKSTFQVYINKAFIEVKGTCFLVKQSNAEKNEITLFHGKIEFNVESTGKKTVMKPMQKMVYNPTNAQTEIRNIIHVNWKDGKFHFKDVPLQQLIKTINQIYDTNIVLDKMINHESAFTGIIRYDEPLEDVISKICFSLNLTQEKQKDHIMIKNE